MAVNSLNLLTVLRPWRSAGISHLLADGHADCAPDDAVQDDTIVNALPAQADFAQSAPPPPVPAYPARSRATAGTEGHDTPPAQNHSQDTTAPRSTGRPDSGLPHPAPKARAAVAPSAAAPVFSPAPSPDMWPEPWRQLLLKAKPAPLLWSYAELAVDLLEPTGESRARSGILRALINDLNLPKGTSTFWPLLAPSGIAPGLDAGLSGLTAPVRAASPAHATVAASGHCADMPFLCSPFFTAGLTMLAPRIIVVFGARSASSLPAPGFFTQEIVSGRAVVYLPSFTHLAESQSAQNRAAVFLRSMVMQFSILIHT